MIRGRYLAKGVPNAAELQRNAAGVSGRVRTLLFDLDDTLYDQHTAPLHMHQRRRIWQFIHERLGVPEAEAYDTWKRGFEHTHQTLLGLRWLGFEVDTAEFEEFIRCGYDEHLSEDAELRGMLDSLPQRKVVFTNGSEMHAGHALRALGLHGDGLWDGVYGADFMGDVCKPDMDAFFPVLQAVGARPYECAMFEDSMKNVRTAKRLGMFTVFVAGSQASDEAMAAAREDPAVDVAVRRVHELREACPQMWFN